MNPNIPERGLFARTRSLFSWEGSIPRDAQHRSWHLPSSCLCPLVLFSSWDPHESVSLHVYGSSSCARSQSASTEGFLSNSSLCASSGEDGRPWCSLDGTLSGSKTTAPRTRQGPRGGWSVRRGSVYPRRCPWSSTKISR